MIVASASKEQHFGRFPYVVQRKLKLCFMNVVICISVLNTVIYCESLLIFNVGFLLSIFYTDSSINSFIFIMLCCNLDLMTVCVFTRPIHWPLIVLGRKRPILYFASVELPPSIAIVMYVK